MELTYSDIYSTTLLAFITFFSTLNPINCLIVYLKLTDDFTHEKRLETRNKSILVSSSILIILMLIGEAGFKLLGINLYSVKIAGGIILFVASVAMVFGGNREIKKDDIKNAGDNISVVPLALPVISGPAIIVSSIILFAQYDNYILKTIVFSMLILNLSILYFLFSLADFFINYIKKSVLNILFILSGIILTAIAVQFIVNGIKDSGVLKKMSYNSNNNSYVEKETKEHK